MKQKNIFFVKRKKKMKKKSRFTRLVEFWLVLPSLNIFKATHDA